MGSNPIVSTTSNQGIGPVGAPVGSTRLAPWATHGPQGGGHDASPAPSTALLRRVLRQIGRDGTASTPSIIDAGEQLGLVLDEAG